MARPEDISEALWDGMHDDFQKAWDDQGAIFNPASNSISDGLWDRLVEASCRAILTAVEEEREACAAICEETARESIDDHEAGGAYECARAIRNRKGV